MFYISVDFYNATFFDISSDKLNFFTPNNTSDGMLKKTWIVENNVRYLLKGGYRKSMQEPINERLATMVCEVLGFNHTPYEIVRHKDILYDMKFSDAVYGKFFSNSHKNYEDIIKNISDINKISRAKLHLLKTDVANAFKELLKEHQDITHMSNENINLLVNYFICRVDYLERFRQKVVKKNKGYDR